ncbi:tetratricopeptide repeat protein [uncultured Methanobacterium sp.]|uniref:tetratricopeptide repeat protein n=1 Tax=uncultured Methanobacterium sp. TaxID=176306 RepID=UPI002AA93844|nr:tetratricopeptide repeat protein [uncultured Methanobacterium sp.]
MRKSSSSLLLGSLFLLLFVGNITINSNIYSFSDIFLNIYFGAFGFMLFLYGIFDRFEYYNRTHYRILAAVGLIAILLLVYSMAYYSIFEGNRLLNILFIVLGAILVFLVTGTGETTHWMDKYQKITESFNEAMESGQDAVMVWNQKGLHLMEVNEYQKAIGSFDRALEIEPDNVMVMNNKGISLTEIRKFSQAFEIFDRAFELEPENTKILNNKGYSLMKAGKYPEAIGCYEKALMINPKNLRLWYNKGITLGLLEEYEYALECFNLALELDPENAEIWYSKGNTLLKLVRDPEAMECFSMATEMDPDFKPAKKMNRKMNRKKVFNFGRN